MMLPDIGARIDDVRDEMKRLLAHLESFPTEGELRQNEGASYGVAKVFRAELARTMAQVAAVSRALSENLEAMDATVRAAVEDLVEQDAEAKDSADRMIAFLDNIKEAPPAPAAASGGAVSAPPAAPAPDSTAASDKRSFS